MQEKYVPDFVMTHTTFLTELLVTIIMLQHIKSLNTEINSVMSTGHHMNKTKIIVPYWYWLHNIKLESSCTGIVSGFTELWQNTLSQCTHNSWKSNDTQFSMLPNLADTAESKKLILCLWRDYLKLTYNQGNENSISYCNKINYFVLMRHISNMRLPGVWLHSAGTTLMPHNNQHRQRHWWDQKL